MSGERPMSEEESALRRKAEQWLKNDGRRINWATIACMTGFFLDAQTRIDSEMVQLLRESQDNIGGTWRDRRDALLSRIKSRS